VPDIDEKPAGLTLTLEQTTARLRDIEDEMSRLERRDDLNDDDEERFETLATEARSLTEHKKKIERKAALTVVKEAARGRQGGFVEKPVVDDESEGYDADPMRDHRSSEDVRTGKLNPWDLSNLRTAGRQPEQIAGEYRNRALDAVQKMRGATDKIRSAATDIIELNDDEDGRISQLALVTSDPAYFRAFSKMAKNPNGADLLPEERAAVARAKQLQRAMSLTDSAGGFLVPFQLDPTVIITANGSVNQIRQVARTVTGVSDTWQGVTSGAVSWSWDAEASQVSDDATTFAQPAIPAFMARGFVPISIEARQDEANVATEVGRLLAFGKDVLEAAAFATGNGTTAPKGVITALVAAGGLVTSATTDVLAIADIYALQGALPARYRMSAAWLGNNAIYNRVRQFDTSGGGGFWTNLNDGRPPSLMGRPALEAEDMDGSLTALADNYVLVYGDFSNYVIYDRLGLTVDFIPHLFQQTTAGTGFGLPTGQSGWFAYYRAGASVVNTGAFRLLNVT